MPPAINTNTTNNNPVIVCHEVIIEGTPPRPETMRGPEEPKAPQDPRTQQREIIEVDNRKFKEMAARLDKNPPVLHRDTIREDLRMGSLMIFAKLDQAQRETDPGFKKQELKEALFYLRLMNEIRSNPSLGAEDQETLRQLNQKYLDQVRPMNLGDPELFRVFFLKPNSRTNFPVEINHLLKRNLSRDVVFSEIAKDFPGAK